MNLSRQTEWTCLASAAIKWRWYIDADPSFAFDIVHRVHFCKIGVFICSLKSFDVGKGLFDIASFGSYTFQNFRPYICLWCLTWEFLHPLTVCGTVFYTSAFLVGGVMCCFGSACVYPCEWAAQTFRIPYIWSRWMDFFPFEVLYLVGPVVAPHWLIHGPKTCQIWRQWGASFAEYISLKPLDGLSPLEVLWSCLVVQTPTPTTLRSLPICPIWARRSLKQWTYFLYGIVQICSWAPSWSLAYLSHMGSLMGWNAHVGNRWMDFLPLKVLWNCLDNLRKIIVIWPFAPYGHALGSRTWSK